jgi:hypothetical protein
MAPLLLALLCLVGLDTVRLDARGMAFELRANKVTAIALYPPKK